MSPLRKSEYKLKIDSIDRHLRIVILSDLHSRASSRTDKIIELTEEAKPDYILMPGDIFERLDGGNGEDKRVGFELMEKAARIATVLYSVGNHENGGIRSWDKLKWKRIKCIPKFYAPEDMDRIMRSGVTVVDDGYTVIDGIAFGGIASGLINEGQKPSLDWLEEYCALKLPKILLCHHPEYYPKYLRERDIDLIVSGHAHGGQWRIFGRGVFAPGQGIFPKYTSGVYDSRLVVSRGLKPSGTIPRIFNPPEVVVIDINKEK